MLMDGTSEILARSLLWTKKNILVKQIFAQRNVQHFFFLYSNNHFYYFFLSLSLLHSGVCIFACAAAAQEERVEYDVMILSYGFVFFVSLLLFLRISLLVVDDIEEEKNL
jgi:hypothetical protein